MKSLITFILLMSAQAYCRPVTAIQLTADVVKADSEEVVIKNQKGQFKIPRWEIKNNKVMTGKDIELYMDADTYERLRAQYASPESAKK
jgi:hypothetical protein